MTRDEVKAYIKKTGKFPKGWTRCMDCRCTGQGECAGETHSEQRAWQRLMDDELGGKSR